MRNADEKLRRHARLVLTTLGARRAGAERTVPAGDLLFGGRNED
jgi:hypothetical protein